MTNLDLAVIGNCSISALIDSRGKIVWSCLPRFDSDPRFCALLDSRNGSRSGFFDIELLDLAEARQSYRHNSAVLETTLRDRHGGALQVIDFAPRFKHLGRTFRPAMIIRQVVPIAGAPRIRVRLRPSYEYGAHSPETTCGSNHVRYVMPDLTLRLTTNASVTYVTEEVPFIVETPISLLLGPDESLTESASDVARQFLEKTDDHWRDWCRALSIPFEWQDAVIRAAITLKLSNFEESGAIIAAPTTSIPESPASGRNWDYRYCWLRDSYFVVHALNGLGATKTMEGYLNYIMNLAAASEDGYLQPVFGLLQDRRLAETTVDSLAGYRGMGPVRTGNDAYRQVQNDGYGAVLLSCAQIFFDRRLDYRGDVALFERLEKLGKQAAQRWDQPDAGFWELRSREAVHTYSAVMCWAACDRLGRIAKHLQLEERAQRWRELASSIREQILRRAWNEKLQSFVSTFDGEAADAVLLLLPKLGFVDRSDPRFAGTVAQVEKDLKSGPYVRRYATADDIGVPEVAFNACTFWYIDALAQLGRKAEARDLFENMLNRRNPLGLLSEDIAPDTGELWGNFPQTYSMVGLIHSAMALSRHWEEAF
ncbi:MAG: glycoside hydrolase family 15 protein [Kiloniellales bacterium]